MPRPDAPAQPSLVIHDTRHATLFRVGSGVVFVLSIIMMVGTSVLLYRHVYKRTGDVARIMNASAAGTVRAIDFERLAKIQTAWDAKHALPSPELVRDPFNNPSVRAASTSQASVTSSR